MKNGLKNYAQLVCHRQKPTSFPQNSGHKVGLIFAYVIFIAFIFETLLLPLIFYDIIVTIYYKEVEESILISQKSIIKLSLLYILKLFLTVIASMLIMSVMTIIIRFIPNVSNTNTENLLIAIVAGIAEIIVFFSYSIRNSIMIKILI